ncbi:MAG: sugar phosphate isomerase/epimerase, partial [Saprospiraceae bacterium]
MQRRKFIHQSSRALVGVGLFGWSSCGPSNVTEQEEDQSTNEAASVETPLWFDVSLAQWSLHRAFEAGSIDPLDFARTAREDYGIEGVE